MIYALNEGDFGIDSFVERSVNTNALTALPSAPPAQFPQAVTRGEILGHILAEFTDAFHNGQFNKEYKPVAHASGLDFENEYRARHGQNIISNLEEPAWYTTPSFAQSLYGTQNATNFWIEGGFGTQVITRGSWMFRLFRPSVREFRLQSPVTLL